MAGIRKIKAGADIDLLDDAATQTITIALISGRYARLSDLATSTSPAKGAGLLGFHADVPYPPGSVGAVILALLQGAGSTWQNVDALLPELAGRISESLLTTALRNRIALVDAEASVAGSVNRRLGDEAAQRGLDIAEEARLRALAITSAVNIEVGNRNIAIGLEASARGDALAALAAVKNRSFYSATAPTSNAFYALEVNDTWYDASRDGRASRWNGSAWVAAEDARIGRAVTDINTERTQRTTADLAEVSARESLYAAFSGAASGDYKVFNQAPQPLGSTIGDLWTWKTADGDETFKRWSGSAWVESAADRRAAVYRGEFANDAALPTTGNVIGDLARRATDNTVRVWNGVAWVAKPATSTPAAAFVDQERVARASADQVEASTRQLLSAKLTGAADPAGLTLDGLSSGLLFDERQARASADSAEAISRSTLATQMRGAYTGTSVSGVTEGLLYDERVSRSTADSAEVTLRQALSAKLTGAADPAGLTLDTLTSGIVFDERQARASADSAEAISRSTLATQMRGAYTGTSVSGVTEGLLYDERVSRSTADSAEVTLRQALSAKLTGANDPASLTLDTLSSGIIFDERQARASADSAEAISRSTLATQMRGAYTGTSVNGVTEGLLYDERVSRSNADGAEVTARQILSAKLTGANDPAGLTLETLAGGLIFDERQARASADSAEAISRSTLATQMRGAYTGTSVNGVTEGLLYDERVSRSNADSAEVTARQTLSATLTGTTNPAGLTLAALTSGLVFDEREARANAISGEAYSRSLLEARVLSPTVGNNPTYAAVVNESIARANTDGTLLAQNVLKVVGVRSDGRKVFASIGLAATAPNDATGGQSEIVLTADSLLFVPANNINAAPSGVFSLGLVDGVLTLIVPAARIGDLTVGSAKIAGGAVTNFVYNTIAFVSRPTFGGVYSRTTTVELGRITTAAGTDGRVQLIIGMKPNLAAGIWPVNTYYTAGCRLLNGGGGNALQRFRIYRNSTVVAEHSIPTTNNTGNLSRITYLNLVVDAPGAVGLCVYTYEIFTSSESATDHYHEIPDLFVSLQEFKK